MCCHRSGGRCATAAGLLLAVAVLCGCGRDGNHDSVMMVGTIERDRLEMLAPVSEILVSLPVHEGDRLKAGDIVAQLDDARLKAEVTALRHARDAEKARLDELEAGFRSEHIAQARASYAASVAAVELAIIELRRADELVRKNTESRDVLDRARSTHDQAQAEKQRRAEALREMERGPRAEQIRAQRSLFEAASGRLAEAQVRLDQLTIKAPYNCTVSTLPFRVGERLLAGVSVAALRASDRTFARVFVPERVKAKIAAGRECTAKVDGVEREFKARVRVVESEASFTPFYLLTERERDRLSFAAKVDLIEPEARELPVGVPVTVQVRVQ